MGDVFDRLQAELDSSSIDPQYLYSQMIEYVRQNSSSYSNGVRLWLEFAQQINSPGPSTQNAIKYQVFESNRLARLSVDNHLLTDDFQQLISNELAKRVARFFIETKSDPSEFSSQALYDEDVALAVAGLSIPSHLWAGGYGGLFFGMDVFGDGTRSNPGFIQNEQQFEQWCKISFDVILGTLDDSLMADFRDGVRYTWLDIIRSARDGLVQQNSGLVPSWADAVLVRSFLEMALQHLQMNLGQEVDDILNRLEDISEVFFSEYRDPRTGLDYLGIEWLYVGEVEKQSIVFILDEFGIPIGSDAEMGLVAHVTFEGPNNYVDPASTATRTERVVLHADGETSIFDGLAMRGPDYGGTAITASRALGSSIGRRLFGDDVIPGALAGAALGEISGQLSAGLFSLAADVPISEVLDNALSNILGNASAAAVGSISSYLAAEVIAELGISGFAGQITNTAASSVLNQLSAALLIEGNNFTEAINSLGNVNFGSVFGGFVGSKLAGLVKSFDTVGGQIGFSVGSAVGAFAAGSAISASSTAALGAQVVANFLAPGVGAFVGALLGGLIGSLFGGDQTPESGAHLIWDASTENFGTETITSSNTDYVWADDWRGNTNNREQREVAIGLAQNAADVINRVLNGAADGGATALIDVSSVVPGAYGRRNSEWLYWGAGEDSEDHSLTGRYDNSESDHPQLDAVNHGIRRALESLVIRGGDPYLKRAIYQTLATTALPNRYAATTFDFSALIGDLSVAADMSFLDQNRAVIDAARAFDPQSSLAYGWLLTEVRASELGLDTFQKSDLYGGLGAFLQYLGIFDGGRLSPGDIELVFTGSGGNDLTIRNRHTGADELVIPDFAITMGYNLQTVYQANDGATSNIRVMTGSGEGNFSDSAYAGTALSTNYRGQSQLADDIVQGDARDSVMYGHEGWDWLSGAGGTDQMWGHAGNDYLSGGDGNDAMFGGVGDDVLDGGSGDDQIYSGDGDDLMYFGSGSDRYDGEAGNDTISFAATDRLDGSDRPGDLRFHLGSDPDWESEAFKDDVFLSIENIIGSRFDDRLFGSFEANVIDGGAGSDRIFGLSGEDILIGGRGADFIDGGNGLDTLSYRTSRGGVYVDLHASVLQWNDAEGDTLEAASIERLEGSDFDDVLRTRNSSDRQVWGLGGNDTFLSLDASVQMWGGDGIDIVDYSESSAAVTVNLATNTASGGWAAGDKLYEMEGVIGSNFGDYITGTDADERFTGGTGNDTINGGAGDDSYVLTDISGIGDIITDTGGTLDYMLVGGDQPLNSFLLKRQNNSLIVQYYGQKTYVTNQFNDQNNSVLERVLFENGAFLDIRWLTNFYSGSGTIEGSATNASFVRGLNSDDSLYGGDRGDILVGSGGTDNLYGGSGNDQYLIFRGSGLNYIREEDDRLAGFADTLVLAGDISADNLMVEYVGDDLHIGIFPEGAITAETDISSAPDRVVIVNQKNRNQAIEVLRLGNQTIDLPRFVGDWTGENNAPQLPPENELEREIYSPFSGGRVGIISAFDADGDPLTYTVTDTSGFGAGTFSFEPGSNNIITTQSWSERQSALGPETTTINFSVSDGTAIAYGSLEINWEHGGSTPLYPIVLDMDGDGIELIKSNHSGILADFDGDGFVDRIGWASGDDAFLTIDRDGSGMIDRFDEISFTGDLEGATTDLEGLRGFDFDAEGNADGVLDANDVFFRQFMVWQDANENGVSDEGELRSLEEVGITQIDLAGTPVADDPDAVHRNAIFHLGSFTRDGVENVFGDVALGIRYGQARGNDNPNREGRASRRDVENLFGGVLATGSRGAGEGGSATPIVFDLDGNGIDLRSIGTSTANFDIDGDGTLEAVGWSSPNDAFLAIDIDGDGAITNGAELSFTQFLVGAQTDLEGLRGLDSDGDGLITEADNRFGDLLLWADRNADGISQENELLGLSEFGITEIGLSATPSSVERGGNRIFGISTYRAGDHIGVLGDVALGYVEIAVSDNVPTGGNFSQTERSLAYDGWDADGELRRLLSPSGRRGLESDFDERSRFARLFDPDLVDDIQGGSSSQGQNIHMRHDPLDEELVRMTSAMARPLFERGSIGVGRFADVRGAVAMELAIP